MNVIDKNISMNKCYKRILFKRLLLREGRAKPITLLRSVSGLITFAIAHPLTH